MVGSTDLHTDKTDDLNKRTSLNYSGPKRTQTVNSSPVYASGYWFHKCKFMPPHPPLQLNSHADDPISREFFSLRFGEKLLSVTEVEVFFDA